jgi:hypothetical protein
VTVTSIIGMFAQLSYSFHVASSFAIFVNIFLHFYKQVGAIC